MAKKNYKILPEILGNTWWFTSKHINWNVDFEVNFKKNNDDSETVKIDSKILKIA